MFLSPQTQTQPVTHATDGNICLWKYVRLCVRARVFTSRYILPEYVHTCEMLSCLLVLVRRLSCMTVCVLPKLSKLSCFSLLRLTSAAFSAAMCPVMHTPTNRIEITRSHNLSCNSHTDASSLSCQSAYQLLYYLFNYCLATKPVRKVQNSNETLKD